MGMTREQIFSFACNDELPGEPMTLPQMLLYYRCKDIAHRYRQGKISKAAVNGEKLTAFRDFEYDTADYIRGKNALDCISEIHKAVELAASDYGKGRTIECADKLLAAIENSLQL